MITCRLFIAILMTCASFIMAAPATNPAPLLTLENDFIKLIVNDAKEDTGRFSIETTSGDPANPLDDNQPLIFGRPVPWTSYTTVQIDDTSHVFGGPNKKIKKRGGKDVHFGEVTFQGLTDQGLESETFFPGNKIRVRQKLSFVRNPSTRVKDMAMITYDVINEDEVPHDVGVRIMLDTKLGQNDGAPFRIGDMAATTEREVTGEDLVDYWQTFDNLSSPNVIAQGILNQQDMGVQPPDRLYLVNWGTLVDHPWTFGYEPGRPFIRAGEIEKDTSLAMYWDPITLGPKSSRTVRTLYGLGGVTLKAGQLSLGITAPAEFYSSSEREFLVVAYVLNAGDFDSKNTRVNFNLPRSFHITEGEADVTIGTLKAGETRQIPIRVKLNNPFPGNRFIMVRVTSDTLEPNSANRLIHLIAPPELGLHVHSSPHDEDALNVVYDVRAHLKNDSDKSVANVNATLSLPDNMAFPFYEIPTKETLDLSARSQALFHWKVVLKDGQVPSSPLRITIDSKDTRPLTRDLDFNPLSFPSRYILVPSTADINVGEPFFVWVVAHHTADLQNDIFTLTYDKKRLKQLRWSPEPWLFDHPDSIVGKQPGTFSLGPLTHHVNRSTFKICKVHFIPLKSGDTQMDLQHAGKQSHTLQLSVEKE